MSGVKFARALKLVLLFTIMIIQVAAVNADTELFSLIFQEKKLKLEASLPQAQKIYLFYAGNEKVGINLDLSNSENIKNYSLIWPFPKRDDTNHRYYYENNISIPLYLEVTHENQLLDLNFNVNYIICHEQCIPRTQHIRKIFAPPYVFSKPNLRSFRIKDVYLDSDSLEFISSFEYKIDNPRFAIQGPNDDLINKIIVSEINEYEYKVTGYFEPKNHNKIRGRNFSITSDKADLSTPLIVSAANSLYFLNFTLIVIFGIIGGIILNFMPCVLPILSLKILSLLKGHINKTSLWLNIVGIFCCFQIVAITTILLKNSSRNFGLGANFQYPEFIIFLSLALTFYISVSMERVNIDIPHRLNNFLQSYNFRSESLENFFNGILAVLLSTSCTAPYVGSAMVLALSSDNLMIFTVFSSLSLGFSFPYFLLIAHPKLSSYIPKNPKVIKYIKNVLSLLLLLTLLWLLNILQSQLGLRPTLGFIGLLIILKFIIESSSNVFKKFKLKLLVVSLVVLACFTLPKITYNDSLISQAITDEIWKEFEPNKIVDLIESGKVVVVDIAADWCATCKYNEYIAWENPVVKSTLQKKNIVPMKGDYTGKNDFINEYLRSNSEAGIPFSKIYGPKNPAGVKLPTLLSPSDIVKAIKAVSS